MRVNSFRGVDAESVTCKDNLSVQNNLHVGGNFTVSGSMPAPFWVAGRVNGITQEVLQSKGRNPFTLTKLQTGYYKIGWTLAHPDGDNFIVFAQGEGTGNIWNILHDANDALGNRPDSVTFIARNSAFNITDGIVNFAVLA